MTTGGAVNEERGGESEEDKEEEVKGTNFDCDNVVVNLSLVT